MTSQVAWIAVDWGTTRLRAWAMTADNAVLHKAESDDGMGRLDPSEFEAALRRITESWNAPPAVPVVACGMVGARQGWVEAPYLATPCAPLSGAGVAAPSQSGRFQVWILSGLKQLSPPDVMRGEETQIGGFLASDPDFDGVLCLPGTHTKWARISAGEVVSFQTFMTGELFSVISKNTVLRHSVDAEEWDDAAFSEALGDGLARPDRLASRLFQLRAEGLVREDKPAAARARLSGYLIGAELAAARPYWLGQQVALLGAPALTQKYSEALSAQGLSPQTVDAEAMTLAGLIFARQLERTRS